MFRTALIAAISFILPIAAQADWPQFLGPDRNAAVDDTQIARTWPEGGPKQLWTVPLGEGFGGASIHGDDVFILDRIEEKGDALRCFDLNTGQEKWRVDYDAPGKFQHPGSRSVPAVDDEFVWSVGSLGDLYCFSRATHEVIWNTNFVKQFDAEKPMFGVGQSPLIYKDLVIIAAQAKTAGIVAYDKRTGDLRWASRPMTGQPWYSSPIAATYGGVDQIIAISPYDKDREGYQNEVISIDATNGEVLWTYKGLYSFATIASPKVIDQTRLFLTCGSYNGNYRPISIMLDIRRKNDKFQITEVFKTEEAGSKIHAAVRHGHYLYLNSGDRGEQMTCMSIDGEIMWTGPSFHLAGPILIGDLILNQNGKTGDVFLIQANPNQYTQLGHAQLKTPKNKTPWAPLAYSKGKLLVRHSQSLICLDLMNVN